MSDIPATAYTIKLSLSEPVVRDDEPAKRHSAYHCAGHLCMLLLLLLLLTSTTATMSTISAAAKRTKINLSRSV